jgi:hypothetical protein
MKTPIKEKARMLTHKFNEAKTPEQFMKLMQRGKSPRASGMTSKSPMKA